MIRTLLRLPIALCILVPGAWAALLALPADPAELLGRAAASWAGGPEVLRGRAGLGGRGTGAALRAGLGLARLHAEALGRTAGVQGLFLLAGALGGLALRERLRAGESGYASPTAAALGRGLVGAGLAWGALFALSPLPLGPGWTYAVSMGMGPGAFLYLANLPLRL